MRSRTLLLATVTATLMLATACESSSSSAPDPTAAPTSPTTPPPASPASSPTAAAPTPTSAPTPTTEVDDPAKRAAFCAVAADVKARAGEVITASQDAGDLVVGMAGVFRLLPPAAHTASLKALTTHLTQRYDKAAAGVLTIQDLATTDPPGFVDKVNELVAPALEPFSFVEEYVRDNCGFTLFLTEDGSIPG